MNISRRQFLSQTAMAASVSLLPLPGWLFKSDDSHFHEIQKGIGTYVNRGGTIGWYTRNDVLVVIDTQFPDTAKDFLMGVQKRSKREIDVLINTHHHRDHTGGNPILKPVAVKAVAQKNVPVLQRQAAEKQGTLDKQVYADTLFEKEWSQDMGKEKINCTYYGPAHTGGDSISHFENANIVHMGDLIFNRIHPFIDIDAGGSILHWKEILDQTLKKYDNETVFIFGHGNEKYGVTGHKKDVAVLRDYFDALQEHVQKGIQTGTSRNEITSLKTLKGFEDFKSYGEHFSLPYNIGLTYDEMKKVERG